MSKNYSLPTLFESVYWILSGGKERNKRRKGKGLFKLHTRVNSLPPTTVTRRERKGRRRKSLAWFFGFPSFFFFHPFHCNVYFHFILLGSFVMLFHHWQFPPNASTFHFPLLEWAWTGDGFVLMEFKRFNQREPYSSEILQMLEPLSLFQTYYSAPTTTPAVIADVFTFRSVLFQS